MLWSSKKHVHHHNKQRALGVDSSETFRGPLLYRCIVVSSMREVTLNASRGAISKIGWPLAGVDSSQSMEPIGHIEGRKEDLDVFCL
jgi:hypothetical protein